MALLSAIEPWFGPVVEGPLAFIALLAAIALRRRKRLLTPAGFVLLSLGLIADALARSMPPMAWTRYGRALGLTLILWGLVHIAVDAAEGITSKRRRYFSTTVAEIVRAMLYLLVPVMVLRVVLGFDFAMLGVLSTIPAGGALVGWLLQSTFFRGLVLQSQRPVRPGDWVRIDDQTGQVQSTGWRATRVLTRTHQSLHVPNTLLNQRLVANYSAAPAVADEIFFGLSYDEVPDKVEQVIIRLLSDMPEVLQEPAPSVDPWEYTDAAIRYRIRYWIADFALQERIRTGIVRNLWYALRRNSIGIPSAGHRAAARDEHDAAKGDGASPEQMLAELRRCHLLSSLGEAELRMLLTDARVLRFGRGEVLIREGEPGDSFYILFRGRVEALERRGANLRAVRQWDYQSEDNFFGEIALLSGEPRTVTIRALTNVEVLEVNREGFARLFKAQPDAAHTIADIAAARISGTRERAAQPFAEGAVDGARSKLLATMRRIFDF